MRESEVIIVDGIPAVEYDQLINECVKYSIISLPFTVDRMSIPNEKQRALNIAKGKVAESLFKFFCNQNRIEPDFEACTTPFWTVDKRDFLLDGSEWDIKNNFIYCPEDVLSNQSYSDLPALVPNRFPGDQWSKREQIQIVGSRDIFFLFTFLKNADLTSGTRGSEFLEIVLSDRQQGFIRDLYNKYRGQPQNNQPFTEQWFWDQMSDLGPLAFYRLNFRPHLIITCYANATHWTLFKDTGPYDRNNNFQTYLEPRWYQKFGTGSINFMNGTLWTKITNATVPVSLLPSFLSMHPSLRDHIRCGRLKL